MSQYVIKLSTLADVYATAKSVLADMPKTDEDALSKLAQLESEFSNIHMNAAEMVTKKIVNFKDPSYDQASIPVTSFLDCYYEVYRSGSQLVEDFLFSNDSELNISYQGLCSIYGELMVDNVIKNAMHRGNGVILVG